MRPSFFAVIALLLGLATAANAATQRAFVSVHGADANAASNCSLALPCRSFAAAIGVTNPGGEVIVLDSGGYGPVAIAQDVTIAAPPGVYAGITVSNNNVHLTVERCTIANMQQTGLLMFSSGGTLHVSDTVVSDGAT